MLLSGQQSWLSNQTLLYYDVSESIHPLGFLSRALILQRNAAVTAMNELQLFICAVGQQFGPQSYCSHAYSAICLLLGSAAALCLRMCQTPPILNIFVR